MVEVPGDVVFHRPEEAESTGVAQDVPVEVVPEVPAVGVDEVLHADVVGVGRAVEVPLQGGAGAGLVAVEEVVHPLAVAGDVDPVADGGRPPVVPSVRTGRGVAVLEEHPVMRVEAGQVVEVGRGPVEVTEEALEDVGHQVPGRTHVEPEAVPAEDARSAAELFVLFDEGNVEAGVGEVTGRREAAEAAADDADRRVRRGVHPGHSPIHGTNAPNVLRGRGARSRIEAASPDRGVSPTSRGSRGSSETGLTL